MSDVFMAGDGFMLILGGRSGAELAALDWAIAHGIRYGGWCPHGQKTWEGGRLDSYQLLEAPGENYLRCTEWNVRDSDATLIFTLDKRLDDELKRTSAFAKRLGKPWLHVHAEMRPEEVAHFLVVHAVTRLNVVGTRETATPGVGDLVRHVLSQAVRVGMPDSRKDTEPDILLYITTNIKTSRKRLMRFRSAFLKSQPYNRFAVVTFDASAHSHVCQVVVDGISIDHFIFGVDAVDTLGYPSKGIARPFKLIPGNSDLITLLFRKLQPQFRHYWFLEDDVEYTGDPTHLFEDLGKRKADLLATHLFPSYDEWAYARERYTPGCSPDDTWLVFLPFYRVSRDALDTIDAYYRKGWTGHHENMWATILLHAGRTVVDIGGQGDYVAEADRNRHYYGHRHDGFEKNGSFGTLRIRLWPGQRKNVLWHPVKPFGAWLRQRKKRFVSQCNWILLRLREAIGFRVH
jgi:hypothetical protein